nr:hypothetical protein [Fusarium oxysporum]
MFGGGQHERSSLLLWNSSCAYPPIIMSIPPTIPATTFLWRGGKLALPLKKKVMRVRACGFL